MTVHCLFVFGFHNSDKMSNCLTRQTNFIDLSAKKVCFLRYCQECVCGFKTLSKIVTFFYPKQHICLSYRKGKKNNSVVVILALCFCGWMNWGRRNRATLKGESFECQTNMFSSRSTSTHSWINYILLLRRYQEFMQEKGRRLPIIDIYFLYACINIYYIILFFLLFNISRKHRLLEPEVENIFFWLSVYLSKQNCLRNLKNAQLYSETWACRFLWKKTHLSRYQKQRTQDDFLIQFTMLSFFFVSKVLETDVIVFFSARNNKNASEISVMFTEFQSRQNFFLRDL